MSEIALVMAKLSGIRKALGIVIENDIEKRNRSAWKSTHSNFHPNEVSHYFEQAKGYLLRLKDIAPELYEDFHSIDQSAEVQTASLSPDQPAPMYYSNLQLERLARDIDQIFEIRANSTLLHPQVQIENRVFISHGRSNDWMKVQAFIEKDIQLKSLELAQEYNGGRTIIEKLEDNSRKCTSAVIVMTGEDQAEESELRVRENVMHEIGYFHGLYGRQSVILLHEDGVNIPSNLAGVVYVPFPKSSIEASLYVLQRELKVLYKL